MESENRKLLRQLVVDTFLLSDDEFSFDLRRQDVDTWDSLGVVSLAVGVQEVFGYHLTPEEATGLHSVAGLMSLLSQRGICFDV